MRHLGGESDNEPKPISQLIASCGRIQSEIGSFSAKHGLGPHNAAFVERYVSPEVRATAAALER